MFFTESDVCMMLGPDSPSLQHRDPLIALASVEQQKQVGVGDQWSAGIDLCGGRRRLTAAATQNWYVLCWLSTGVQCSSCLVCPGACRS